MRRIMVMDSDPAMEAMIREHYGAAIAAAELSFVFTAMEPAALVLAGRQSMDVLLADVGCGEASEHLAMLERLVLRHPLTPAIALVHGGDMTRIRGAMNRGAFDFLLKPLQLEDLGITLERALHQVQFREAQEQLRRQKQAAEAASETKDIFLTNMSHELRTPLNAIIGYSEVLIDELDDWQQRPPPSVASDLQRISGAGQQLLKLVDEILDLSQIQAGEQPLRMASVSILALVDETVKVMATSLEDQCCELRVACPAELGAMYTDPAKLQQSLCHLLEFLSLESGWQSHLLLDVYSEQASGLEWILFSVLAIDAQRDADALEQLFQPFMQASAAILQHPPGGVLRLSITRQLCRQMGGDLLVRKRQGRGSCLVIRLPRRDRRRHERDRRGSAPDHS